jgi:hypothetical protein
MAQRGGQQRRAAVERSRQRIRRAQDRLKATLVERPEPVELILAALLQQTPGRLAAARSVPRTLDAARSQVLIAGE